ncbi:MAG: RNA polymerase sigma factor [Acidobacteriota bacterium]
MEEYGDDISDEELVQRSLKGEEDAFQQLYKRYQRPVYAVVYRIISDPEEAQDTTQEVFLTIYRSLPLWSPQKGKFLTWIYRISINCAIDHWRTRRRRAEIQWTEKTEILLTYIPTGRRDEPPVERRLAVKEQVARMHSYLQEFPQQQRRFFILRYYDGLKLSEIAQKEGFKLETVKSSLYRTTHGQDNGVQKRFVVLGTFQNRVSGLRRCQGNYNINW